MINHLCLYKGLGSFLILSFTSSAVKCDAACVLLPITFLLSTGKRLSSKESYHRLQGGITTLPHLTDDYEKVYDRLQQAVSSFPTDRIERHYTRLFEWLRQRFERKVCVERSGISLPMVPALARLFPDAKFIHIIRDGRTCALSMSRHHGFRLMVIHKLQEEILGVHPTASDDRTKRDALSEDLQWILPECFDPDIYRNYHIPMELFGKIWSQMCFC